MGIPQDITSVHLLVKNREATLQISWPDLMGTNRFSGATRAQKSYSLSAHSSCLRQVVMCSGWIQSYPTCAAADSTGWFLTLSTCDCLFCSSVSHGNTTLIFSGCDINKNVWRIKTMSLCNICTICHGGFSQHCWVPFSSAASTKTTGFIFW